MITIVGDGVPEASAEFQARLRRFDPALWVTWNRRRRRWVIEQCVRHHSTTAEHSHVCERSYVWMVQDPEGGPMPLGDAVFQQLGKMDMVRQGFGPDKLEEFREACRKEDIERQAKYEADVAEAVRLNSRDHRRQLATAWTLMQRHDMRPNR